MKLPPLQLYITAQEQCKGRLARIHGIRDVRHQVPAYEKLGKLFVLLNEWRIVPFDMVAAEQFLQLRQHRVSIGTQDLKIASIALVHNATLLSDNLRDFRQVPGLKVESWLD